MAYRFTGAVGGLLILLMAGCAAPKQAVLASSEIQKSRNFPRTDAWLSKLLDRYPQYFDSLRRQNETWQMSFIYTRIDRKKNGDPVFTHYFFNVDPQRYFYPASTVKMPVAVLSLQKLRELNRPGLDRNSTMITEAGFPGQAVVYNDPETEDGRPTIGNYIRKIFLVSDNDAFNRLYEFLGQEYCNRSLHRMGFDSVQILHRLNISLTEEQNRQTNPVKFYDTAANLLYEQPLIRSNLVYQPRHTLLGKGYYTKGKLVEQPFDFSAKNRVSLADLHAMLQSLIFPAAVDSAQRFGLEDADYRFLYRQMSMLPRESDFPQYDTAYPDAYIKFLLFGGAGPIADTGIRIFNKPGDAYGFLTDVAYVADFENQVEFFLSATILCNRDQIFNDDKYDYQAVGLPFMKNLGRVIYEEERKRKRKRAPDLSPFKFSYGK